MSNRYANGIRAIAICDVCGFQFRLHELRQLIVKTKNVNVLACAECWSPDQPQLQLGMTPVSDPQGLRNPRPDNTYVQSGVLANGKPGGGSRDIEWGWNPVGGSRGSDAGLTPNSLVLNVEVGIVEVIAV
jgi:hypothetical protein